MNSQLAKSIGRRQTVKFGLIGVVFAYLLATLIGGPLWVFEGIIGVGVFVGLAAFVGSSYWIGGEVGFLIIIKRWNMLVGLGGAFMIVWLSVTVAGLVVGFGEPNVLTDYVWKLIISFTLFGGIPILILGVLVGYTVESRGKSTEYIKP